MSFVISVDLSNRRIDPPLDLEGTWEVGLLDAYLNLPHKTGNSLERKYGKEDFIEAVGEYEMFIRCEITQDRLSRAPEVREAFKKYRYGNLPRKAQQSSQFDIWNYKIRDSRRRIVHDIHIYRTFTNYFETYPDVKITLGEVLELLNAQLIEQFNATVNPWLKYVFNQTGGENAVITSPYFQIPKLRSENGLIKLNTPFFIKNIYLNKALNKIFKFHSEDSLEDYDIILKRVLIGIPSPLSGMQYVKDADGEGGKQYNFQMEEYKVTSPCKELIGFSETVIKDPRKLFILMPDVIEETKIGNSAKPLLRMMEWKDGTSYTQFRNPIYSKLRYNKLGDFAIKLAGEDFTESYINIKGRLALHFRLKIEDE